MPSTRKTSSSSVTKRRAKSSWIGPCMHWCPYAAEFGQNQEPKLRSSISSVIIPLRSHGVTGEPLSPDDCQIRVPAEELVKTAAETHGMETMVHIMECGLADAVPGGIIILDEDKYVASPRITFTPEQ
ncbi:hypothetical protein I7I51_03386 [Histoplasma capsulatum]|uniref:Uncharacterized protein n=1 Tax=Ajellomyces capsulatus TaxID=5037 RepID=A0A8A1M9B9_AJECA|nr:hypothetical protein I7I51_03386 [Histoplasma capsulatum]